MSLQDKNTPAHYFSLQPSEMAVFRGACQIYAGYVATGQVTTENSTEFQRRAIMEAIKIGKTVEKAVESDDELKGSGSTESNCF